MTRFIDLDAQSLWIILKQAKINNNHSWFFRDSNEPFSLAQQRKFDGKKMAK